MYNLYLYTTKMERNITIPEERPNPNKIEKKKAKDTDFEIMKILKYNPEDEDQEKSDREYRPDININKREPAPIVVSLSWDKNLKSVTNWMRKHMLSFPETRNGFLVRFMDNKENKWYKVEPCNDREKWEKINWINYKISPCEFSTSEKEGIERFIKNKKKDLIDTLYNEKNMDN